MRQFLSARISLALAAAAVFGLTLTAGFVLDDYSLFSDASVTSASGWWQVWRFSQTRPLTYFTFWLNYTIGARNPFGYHLLNVALHVAAALLLFDLLARLIPRKAAIIATTIFALHPIQTEPVAYVFERAIVLATLLCLLAARFWLSGRPWIAVACFGAALLAKEECAAFPLLLLLPIFCERRSIAAVVTMLLLALGAGLRVIAVAAPAGSGAGFGAAFTPSDYFATQGLVILRYFRLLLIPYGFTVDPDISVVKDWTGVAAWCVIIAVAIMAFRSRSAPGLWLLAGLLLLLPSSSIFPINDLAADRRMYLPMVGFATAAGLLLDKVLPKLLVLLGGVIVVLALARVQVWRSERALWQEAVERAPEKVRPKVQLARVSDTKEAIELLTEAKRLAPDDARVASSLGSRYLGAGKTGEALAEFGRALALAPNDAFALNNRGVALLALKQRAEARLDFERALQFDPCLFNARFNLLQLGVRTEVPPTCGYSEDQRQALGER